MKIFSVLRPGAGLSALPFRRAQKSGIAPSVCLGGRALATLALLGACAAGFAQDTTAKTAPVKIVHVLRPSSVPARERAVNAEFRQRVLASTKGSPVNTGSGVVYTCDSSVATSTCTYLNTTVAGWYNQTFTNANASIYITYGATSLGSSTSYGNSVGYEAYIGKLAANTNQSAVQAAALAAIGTYATPTYAGDQVGISAALGTTLGFKYLNGITASQGSCTLPATGCYDVVITITNDPGIPLYYDDQGGDEPSDAYDFYGTVAHETDEVLGTSSCTGTNDAGTALTDNCGAGVPSVVDLDRYSSAGHIVLASTLDTTPGQYFSYNGGVTNGANGSAGTPKVYNTLANGDDYADYVSSSPDCGTNQAIQDAEGCPGEDKGQSILNDGGSEITILNAIGYDIPAVTKTAAAISLPTSGSAFTSSSVTFKWSAGMGAVGYYLEIGSTGVGSNNIYNSQIKGVTTYTFPYMPTNGETIYVRLYTTFGTGPYQYHDYTYTAAGAKLSAPMQGSTFTGKSATFTWNAAAGATGYYLEIGSTGAGSNNIYNSEEKTVISYTFPYMPTNGEEIYVRLYTNYNGTWYHTDYTYTAYTQPAS